MHASYYSVNSEIYSYYLANSAILSNHLVYSLVPNRRGGWKNSQNLISGGLE